MTIFRAFEKCVIAPFLGMTILALGMVATPASATEAFPEVPWWHVNVGSRPTYLPPGGEGTVVILATNLGDGEVNGSEGAPVTVKDKLPAGIEATEAFYAAGSGTEGFYGRGPCSGSSEVVCSFAGFLPPYRRVEVKIRVSVNGTLDGQLADDVSVSGGGAPGVSVSDPLTIDSSQTPFGVETYELTPENANGTVDTQAGSHPFQLTGTMVLDAGTEAHTEEFDAHIAAVAQPALPKDLHFALPPGFVGNPTPFPQCPEALLYKETCPVDTQLGAAVVTLGHPLNTTVVSPVYNMAPAPGEPARLGFNAPGIPVLLDTSVRTGEDYGVTLSSDNITQTGQLLSAQVTIWGVPGDPRHDRSRDEVTATSEVYCLGQSSQEGCPKDTISAPFLALPTSCGNLSAQPLESTVTGDSWSAPRQPSQDAAPLTYKLHDQTSPSIALDGCEGLNFEPSIKVTPNSEAGSSPSGLNVDVHVPQSSILVPNGLAESDLKNITVTLPEGLQVNPSAADGLQACTQAEIGFKGENPETHVQEFTPEEPSCPNSSKIGTATIHTPLLPNPLKGFVYLASPQNFAGPLENPFGSLVAMYVVVRDQVSGVLVKLPGSVSLNEATGQITASFDNNPQLPFEDAELEFFGGERAPLATPARCGSYVTNASFTPWSGNAPVPSISEFKISSGPNGSACQSPLPFTPSLHASSANLQAGGFTPFTTTFSREDGQQNLQGIQLHMPAGLSGLLSAVKPCGEAQANAGTCGPESEIGETIVSVGVGGDPFSVTGGKVYITEKYEDAPFGLSIVNPAKAGPFDLQEGRPVIVRAKIEVNPLTAALTVTTNSPGEGDAIPTIIDGIPLQIKHVNVTINRPGFTFNPTDCNPLKITGGLTSAEGATASLEVPFQITDCAALAFKPKFAVTTSGHSSRKDGASLDTTVTYPSTPQGTEANIARVKVSLPVKLPARLTTLQKACPEQTFAANVAGCPAASMVGEATAKTPVLPVPLNGPAYFVSHGGAKYPELVVVLQGDNVTIDLRGETAISKKGVLTSTFNAVPDAPFSSFELKLPEGPYSALTANGANLCKAGTLTMPTELVAQDGAVIKQSTRLKVTGCPKKKPKHRAKGGKHKK